MTDFYDIDERRRKEGKVWSNLKGGYIENRCPGLNIILDFVLGDRESKPSQKSTGYYRDTQQASSAATNYYAPKQITTKSRTDRPFSELVGILFSGLGGLFGIFVFLIPFAWVFSLIGKAIQYDIPVWMAKASIVFSKIYIAGPAWIICWIILGLFVALVEKYDPGLSLLCIYCGWVGPEEDLQASQKGGVCPSCNKKESLFWIPPDEKAARRHAFQKIQRILFEQMKWFCANCGWFGILPSKILACPKCGNSEEDSFSWIPLIVKESDIKRQAIKIIDRKAREELKKKIS